MCSCKAKRVWSSTRRALFGVPADVDPLATNRYLSDDGSAFFLTPNPPSTWCSGAGKVETANSAASRSECSPLHVWQPVRATLRNDLTDTMSVGLCG